MKRCDFNSFYFIIKQFYIQYSKKNPFLKRNGFYNHCKVCNYHTLISTSTPLGNSNFIRASTVLEEEE
jgi:hypothetical protein